MTNTFAPECTVDGCEKPSRRRGLCSMHDQRLRRHGSTDTVLIPRLAGSVQDRFWPRVQVGSPDECWPWTGTKTKAGYGMLSAGDHQEYAHRLSYVWHHGPIPAGLELDHLCRNRACVNPNHLEAVTALVNRRRGLLGVLLTHCPQGHEYTADNIYWGRKGPYRTRHCRTCALARAAVARRRA